MTAKKKGRNRNGVHYQVPPGHERSPSRCPDCGGWVYKPCLACKAMDGGHDRPFSDPVLVIKELSP